MILLLLLLQESTSSWACMYVPAVQPLAQQKKDLVVDQEFSNPNYAVAEEQVSSNGISSKRD